MRLAILLALFLPSLVCAWPSITTDFMGVQLDTTTFLAPINAQVPVYCAGLGKWKAGSSPGGPPSGAASGVLSGCYPGPGFAAISARSILANATNASAAPAALQGAANTLPTINSAGTALAFNLLVDANITAGTITAGSLASSVTNRLMLTPATLGSIEVDGGAGNPPTRVTQGSNNDVMFSRGGGAVPTFFTVSGDGAFACNGLFVISAGAVSLTKQAHLAAHSIEANTSCAAATPAAVSLGANQMLIGCGGTKISAAALSGDVTNSVGVVTVANGAITLAKQANLAAHSIEANTSCAAAVPAAVSLGSNQFMIGCGGTKLATVALSGDVTNVVGAVTIANGAVTLAKQANLAAHSVQANTSCAAAVPAAVSLGSNQLLIGCGGTKISATALSGDVTNVVGAVTIANSAVTNAKMANMNASTLKGRNSSGAGAPQDITLDSTLSMSSGGVLSAVSAAVAVQSCGSPVSGSPASTLNFACGLQAGAVSSGVSKASIASGGVTNARMANMAASTLKGRDSSGTGAPQDLTVDSAIVISSGNLKATPSGVMAPFGGRAIPTGWQECDGTSLTRTGANASLFAALVVSKGTATISNATPAVVTFTSHGMNNGEIVFFETTGLLPTGVSADTNYFVTKIDANTFKLSTTFANFLAGTFVSTSSAGSGTHTLFDAPYGVADSTHFNVPDCRGRYLAGFDSGNATSRLTRSDPAGKGVSADGLGTQGGEQAHTQTTSELVAHNHSINDPGHFHTVNVFATTTAQGTGSGNAVPTTTANVNSDSKTTGISINNTGSGSASNVTPPSLVIRWIIKL